MNNEISEALELIGLMSGITIDTSKKAIDELMDKYANYCAAKSSVLIAVLTIIAVLVIVIIFIILKLICIQMDKTPQNEIAKSATGKVSKNNDISSYIIALTILIIILIPVCISLIINVETLIKANTMPELLFWKYLQKENLSGKLFGQ